VNARLSNAFYLGFIKAAEGLHVQFPPTPLNKKVFALSGMAPTVSQNTTFDHLAVPDNTLAISAHGSGNDPFLFSSEDSDVGLGLRGISKQLGSQTNSIHNAFIQACNQEGGLTPERLNAHFPNLTNVYMIPPGKAGMYVDRTDHTTGLQIDTSPPKLNLDEMPAEEHAALYKTMNGSSLHQYTKDSRGWLDRGAVGNPGQTESSPKGLFSKGKAAVPPNPYFPNMPVNHMTNLFK
jgi:hypothetical protein